MLSQQLVRELLTYDENTGILYWRERTVDNHPSASRLAQWNGKNAGKRAFTSLNTNGYYQGKMHGRNLLAHRVIFLYVAGYIPDQIDHDNRIRTDNRWINLIESNYTKNMQNKTAYATNSSGMSGVTYDRDAQIRRVRINANGLRIHLGRFTSYDEAAAARLSAEQQYGYKRRS